MQRLLLTAFMLLAAFAGRGEAREGNLYQERQESGREVKSEKIKYLNYLFYPVPHHGFFLWWGFFSASFS